jgi:hypothetical protein
MEGSKRRKRKNDGIDANKLARLERVDPQSLHPIERHRIHQDFIIFGKMMPPGTISLISVPELGSRRVYGPLIDLGNVARCLRSGLGRGGVWKSFLSASCPQDLTGSTAPVRQPELRPAVGKVKNWTRETLSLTWRSQLFNVAFTTPS